MGTMDGAVKVVAVAADVTPVEDPSIADVPSPVIVGGRPAGTTKSIDRFAAVDHDDPQKDEDADDKFLLELIPKFRPTSADRTNKRVGLLWSHSLAVGSPATGATRVAVVFDGNGFFKSAPSVTTMRLSSLCGVGIGG